MTLFMLHLPLIGLVALFGALAIQEYLHYYVQPFYRRRIGGMNWQFIGNLYIATHRHGFQIGIRRHRLRCERAGWQ